MPLLCFAELEMFNVNLT